MISVIIPVYNNEKYIGAALDSVRRQTERDLEIVVLNDGSTDTTLEIIRHAAEEDQRIQVHTQAHSGKPSIARNAGLRRSRGEYISFLDGDDLYHPEKLQTGLRVLEGNPAIDVVFHDMLEIEPDGRERPLTRLQIGRFAEHVLAHSVPIGRDVFSCNERRLLFFMSTTMTTIHTSAVLLRRRRLESEKIVFPEDLTIGEDVDLWFRLVKTGAVAYLDKVLSYYRQHGESVTKRPERNQLDLVVVHMRNYKRIVNMLDGDQRRAYRKRIADDLFGLGYLSFKKWHHRDARRLYVQSLKWRWDTRSVRGIANTYLARVLGRPEIV